MEDRKRDLNTLKTKAITLNTTMGQQWYSVVFAMLMMLAFLVDQTQQLCCALFRAVWAKLGSKRLLGTHARVVLYLCPGVHVALLKPSCMASRGRAPSLRWIPRNLSPCLL